MSKITIVDGVNVTEILRTNWSHKAKAINEIRHRSTNYDDVVRSISDPAEYERIAEDAREIVYELINLSSCTKYEKYLFYLYNKNWNFHKKSALSLRGAK